MAAKPNYHMLFIVLGFAAVGVAELWLAARWLG